MRKLATSLIFLALSTVSMSEAQAPENLGFLIVVNEQNPTASLDRKQVASMFLNGLSRWEHNEPVQPVDQIGGPVRENFSLAIVGRPSTLIRRFWQRQIFSGKGQPPAELDGDRAVLEIVRSQPGAIGYVSFDAVLGAGVRPLEITGEPPPISHEPYPERDADKVEEPPPPGPVVIVDPRMPDLLYLSSPNRGLLRSVDGGESWFRVRQDNLGREITALVVDPTHPNIVFAGSRTGLYRSTDGGKRFGFVEGLPRNIIQIAVDPQDSSTLYVLAGIQRGARSRILLRSQDQGRTFKSLRSRVSAFAFGSGRAGVYVVEGKTLLWSEDGQTWYRHGSIGVEVHDLVVDPSNPRQLFGATESGVMRSHDSGAQWVNVGPRQRIHRVLVAPPVLLALGERSIFRSLDEGETWEEVAEVEAQSIARDPRDPDRLIIACAGRFGHSSDRGASWTFNNLPSQATPRLELTGGSKASQRGSAPLPLTLNPGTDDNHVAAIVVSPRNLQVVYAASQHGIWKSLNAGNTWGFAGHGLELTDVHALAIDPVEPWVLYAGTHGAGVWKSTDDGGSWQPARRGLTDLVVHDLLMDPHDSRILYAGTRSGLFISRDAGANWRVLEELVDGSTVYRDEGKTWMAPARALAFEPRHGLKILAGTDRGSIYEGSGVALSAERLDAKVGFHRLRAQAGCQVVSSRSAHRTPKPDKCFAAYGISPGSLAIRDLAFAVGSSEVAYAATLFGLWRRPGGSENWRRFGFDANVAAIAVDPRKPERLYAGTSHGLYRSADTGRGWHEFQVEEPVYSVAVDATGLSIYAGLGQGGIVILRDVGLDDGPFQEVRVRLPERSPDQLMAQAISGGIDAGGSADETANLIREEAWRRLEATPKTRYRLRSRRAAELLEALKAGPSSQDQIDRAREIHAQCREELEAIDGDIRNVSFSPDGRWLATFHLEDNDERVYSELRLHDLASLRPTPDGLRPSLTHWHALHDLANKPEHLRSVWILPDPGPLLAWSASGDFLVTHAAHDRLRVWSVDTSRLPLDTPFDPQPPRIPPAHDFELELPAGVGVVALRDDGQGMVMTGDDGALAWVFGDRGSLGVTSLIEPPDAGGRLLSDDAVRQRRRLVLTPDGRRLLVFDPRGWAGTWLLEAGQGEALEGEVFFEAGVGFAEVALSDDGRWLAGRTDDQVLLWAMKPEGPVSPVVLAEGDRSSGLGFLFSPDQRWLAVHGDGELLVWDVSGPELGLDVIGLEHERELPTFSPDGRFFIVRDHETARIWDLSQRRISMQVEGIRRASGESELFRPIEEWWEWSRKGISSRDRRWFATVQGIDVTLWDLGDVTPRAMIGRVGRFGPVGVIDLAP